MFPSDLQRFSREEFTAPDLLDHRLLYMMDAMVVRETVVRSGLVFIVHNDYREGDDGEHGVWRALDGHFEQKGIVLPAAAQFLIVIRYNFTGVGFYPYWRNPGVHVDVRPLRLDGRRETWFRDKLGDYRPIEEYLLWKIAS